MNNNKKLLRMYQCVTEIVPRQWASSPHGSSNTNIVTTLIMWSDNQYPEQRGGFG